MGWCERCVLVIAICVAVVYLARRNTGNLARRVCLLSYPHDTISDMTLPIRYNRDWGVFMATIHLRGKPYEVIVDTGSRYLVVKRNGTITDAAKEGPPTLFYGTQTEHVQWYESPVKLGSGFRTLQYAISHLREGSTDFNILGLGVGQGHCRIDSDDCVAPLIRQIHPRAKICLSLDARASGTLRLVSGKNCSTRSMHCLPMLRGFRYYGVAIEGMYTIDKEGNEVPIRSAPTRLVLDTGTNMLGTHDAYHDDVVKRMKSRHTVVVVVRQTNGRKLRIQFDPDIYMWGGRPLVDTHELSDSSIMILGSLFMRRTDLVFDPTAHTVHIRRNS